MSKIESDARTLHHIIKPIKFIDDYEWQCDENLNHRLVNRSMDVASDWAPFQSLAILNDRMVATEYWQGLLPIFLLLRWETLPSPIR